MDSTDKTAREIEAQIEAFVLKHPWLRSPLPYCVWYLLTAHEMTIHSLQLLSAGQLSTSQGWAVINSTKYALKYSLKWAHDISPKATQFKVPTYVNRRRLKEANELLQLGLHYRDVESAYINYSRGIAKAEVVQGKRIRFARDPLELSYDVLDCLLTMKREEAAKPVLSHIEQLLLMLRPVYESTKPIGSSGAAYTLPPGLLADVAAHLAEISDITFVFPRHWSFRDIPIDAFREVWKLLTAKCSIHLCAHLRAMPLPPPLTLVLTPTIEELRAELSTQCEHASEQDVVSILKFMTYDVCLPSNRRDPALQPLLPLSKSTVGLAPVLVLGSNLERNTLALLARHPAYKDEYDRASGCLEDTMISEIRRELETTRFELATKKRIAHTVDVPDIDLALYDREAGLVLLVELKWVLPPSEAWEVLSRAEREREGIDQVSKLLECCHEKPDVVWSACFSEWEMPSDVRFLGCVSIRGFCGTAENWRPDIPTIEETLLVDALVKFDNLRRAWNWMTRRSFLPKEGIDYRSTVIESPIAVYTVVWEGYELLHDTKWPYYDS